MSSAKHYSTLRSKMTDKELVKWLAITKKDYNNGKFGAFFRGAFGRIDSTASTATYYILVFNKETLPPNGTITEGNLLMHPQKIIHTSGVDSTFDLDPKEEYLKAKNGIVLLASTTEYSVTLISTAWIAATIYYK